MINLFDVIGILQTMPISDILPEEIKAIQKRLDALAVMGKAPNWGYAGMLSSLAADRDIKDVYDVYATINEWRKDLKLAGQQFDIWNADRLAKS
jgi:hypothetical protein